jgi:Protein of unknown function (DUF2971)
MTDSALDISILPGAIPVWNPSEGPSCLYHYTNTAGLMGIIRSRSLWATDVWYMNDTGEATYAIEMTKRFLDACSPESKEMKSFCFYVKAILNKGWDDNAFSNYIACLSENGDQLSQWRSYGYGRGFSIGFDSVALQELFPPDVSGGALIRKVIYDASLQQRMLSDIYHAAENKLSQQTDVVVGAASGFLIESEMLASSFKHPAFVEEAEVRISVIRLPHDGKPAPDVNFRESALGITPYVEVPPNGPGEGLISAIREVRIGPQPHKLEVQRAVGQFFAANGLSDVEIVFSNVPLRAQLCASERGPIDALVGLLHIWPHQSAHAV